MHEDCEHSKKGRELDDVLDRLKADILPSNAADNLVDACSVLGISLRPLDRSGDPATDIARSFLSRLADFLQKLRL